MLTHETLNGGHLQVSCKPGRLFMPAYWQKCRWLGDVSAANRRLPSGSESDNRSERGNASQFQVTGATPHILKMGNVSMDLAKGAGNVQAGKEKTGSVSQRVAKRSGEFRMSTT
jgi:hypothetical protein